MTREEIKNNIKEIDIELKRLEKMADDPFNADMFKKIKDVKKYWEGRYRDEV